MRRRYINNYHNKQNVMLNLFQHLMFKRFRNKFGMTFNSAFTLAEVLITLTIIGVIAAITIPNLMQKWGDHADVAKVKEAYSILSNALKMAVAENGPLDSWGWPDTTTASWNIPENRLYMAETMKKYLKVEKLCGDGTDMGKGVCARYMYDSSGNDGPLTNGYFPLGLSGTPASSGKVGRHNRLAKIQLTNGMVIGFDISNINNSKRIFLDINGEKKPNRAGYDWFEFTVDMNGQLTPGFENNQYNCNRDFDMNGSNDGSACAYWVIKHGNMDYKYRDVSSEW